MPLAAGIQRSGMGPGDGSMFVEWRRKLERVMPDRIRHREWHRAAKPTLAVDQHRFGRRRVIVLGVPLVAAVVASDLSPLSFTDDSVLLRFCWVRH